MQERQYDLIVIGGGPAGLAAAYQAWSKGAKSVLVIERDKELGGILNQCIHNGFGLHHFKEELTGPEYAARFIQMLKSADVEVKPDTMVLEVTADRLVHAVNTVDGYLLLRGKAIVLAMGCRERTRGAIAIPGDRPAGIFTAGAAQRYLNIEGYLVGKRVLVLGSGDIGLIMARRMTLEGAKVLACVELMPYSNGLNRNIVQCLQDYEIPLYLSHTITQIKGKTRVEQAIVMQVDENRKPIPGTEQVFDCDTILLSVGLIPENELSKGAGVSIDPRTGGLVVYENMQTSLPGIFACGNVVHVHDLVDFVTAESMRAGGSAAAYLAQQSGDSDEACLLVENGAGVTYTVPQKIRPARVEKAVELFFRVSRMYHDVAVKVRAGETEIAAYRRERMAPGEMERILLPKVLLDRANGQTLTIFVEEGES